MSLTVTEVADYLAAQMTLVVGTTIFKGTIPATPDAVLVVLETGSQEPDLGLGTTGIWLERPTLQIIVRGAADDYSAARVMAETAYRKCAQVQGATLGSTLYHLLKPLQSPTLFERDDNGRLLITFNVQAEKEPTA